MSLPSIRQLPLLAKLTGKPMDHDAGEMTAEDLEGLPPDTVFSFGDVLQARKLLLPMLMAAGKPLDDRSLVMEKLVELLQRLPLNSKTSEFLANKFIAMLWRDLPHPAGTNVHQAPNVVAVAQVRSSGELANSRFRNADGSNNNLVHPDMGKSSTPYARSVPPALPKPINLPDPELVYDKLLRRPEGRFDPHPRGLSRLFFSFATIVIHECFQTSDLKRQDLNGTTSYVDLSTLYGNNHEEQQSVRTNVQGMIHPDSFASCHVGMMPPGVIAVLILFSRNHNHIAKRVFEVNEGGRYKPWDSLDDNDKKVQDEMIFQYTRNINVGFFATVVLKDYVSAILATKEANSEWWLNLGAEIHDEQTGRLERGTGLQNTSEFNVLYRWHATLSASDSKWMSDTILAELHKDPACKHVTMDTITPDQFWRVAGAIKNKMSGSPSQWTWPGYLDREANGHINDTQLTQLIVSCMEEPAHRFGARAIPSAMRIVDVLGQLVTRNTFQLCTMNEFRRYLNLKAFDSFEDWNSDKSVAAAASELYGGNIDNLEIYPGLLAEESKPAVPGSGLCPGHTIGRAILADAVQLIRGDRFLTFDFNASTLTNWGAQQIVTFAGGSYGGLLPLLLQRGLPDQFNRFSTWALMPFHLSTAKHAYLTKNGVLEKYNTERPEKRVILRTETHSACKQVLEQPHVFVPPKVKELGHIRLQFTTNERGTSLSEQTVKQAFLSPNYKATTESWVRQCTREEIAHHSITYSSGTKSQLDIVRDICNNVPTRWLANKFGIPLKITAASTDNAFTVRELQETLTDLFTYSSFDGMTQDAWNLRENAKEQWSRLNHTFRARLYRTYGLITGLPKTVHGMVTADFEHVHGTTSLPPLGQLARKVVSAAVHPIETLTDASKTVMQMYSKVSPDTQTFYTQLTEKSGATLEECVDVCFAVVVPLGAIVTRQLSLVVDTFLEPQHKNVLSRITHLVKQDSPSADNELCSYIYDAMRLRSVVHGLPRIVASSGSIREPKQRRFDYAIGDTVIANLSAANHDPAVFKEPNTLMADRNRQDYGLVGCAPYLTFGNEAILPVMMAVVKEVFKLPGLRRGKVNGKLTELSDDAELSRVYLDQRWNETHSPTTMSVEYDVPATVTPTPAVASAATTAKPYTTT